jgi:hypothetical protein
VVLSSLCSLCNCILAPVPCVVYIYYIPLPPQEAKKKSFLFPYKITK